MEFKKYILGNALYNKNHWQDRDSHRSSQRTKDIKPRNSASSILEASGRVLLVLLVYFIFQGMKPILTNDELVF